MTAGDFITWGLQGVGEGAALACLIVLVGVALYRLGAIRAALACAFVYAFAVLMAGCAHVKSVHNPHWWNCQNRVCNSDARVTRVLGAAWDRNRRECDCYVEDSRHLPQWIEVKP